MAEKNEQIHVSAWPIGMPDPATSFADEQCAIGSQYYALATGMIIAKMEHDVEGTCYADIDLGLIPVAKYFINPAEHYSTP